MEGIEGVIIKEISKFVDDRGWLSEIYREDEDPTEPVMSYVSYTQFNAIRGPHEHIGQSDFFVFIGPGDFEIYLWDNRDNSPTYKKYVRLVVGESKRCSILIPPGIVHGYKSISDPGSLCINLPDRLYRGERKIEKVDEIRHEDDPDSEFKIL